MEAESPSATGGRSSTVPGNLWRNGSFTLFWVGQTLSLLGSGMAFVAFPLLVYGLTHSVQQMGLVTALVGVGSLLAGLVAGGLADRLDRRLLLLVCDACSAICYGMLPLCWWLWGPRVWLPFILAAPVGFFNLAATVAGTSSLPRLVESAHLLEANARLQSSNAVAFVVGPVLASGLIGLSGSPVVVLALNATSYLCSVGTLLVIRLRPAPMIVSPVHEKGQGRQYLAGIRFLFRRPLLGWVAALRIAEMFLLAGVFDVLVYRIRHELQQGDATVAWLWGLGTIGAVVGSLIAPRLRRQLGFAPLFLSGLALQALSFLAIGFFAAIPLLVLCGVGVTCGDVWVQIIGAAVLQEQTPDSLQGRVAASVQTGLWLATAVGAAATTTLAALVGSTPPVFWMIGGLMGTLALVASLAPVWHTSSGANETR